MYHSVTINGKNTWTDYHMVPVDGIYFPSPPEQKTSFIDIPMGNGSIDVSTILTGYPVFSNRTGSLSYYILEPYEYGSSSAMGSAYDVFGQIMNDLHGVEGTMWFEDDPNWEYKGHFYVNEVSFGLRRGVTIDYEVFPYKTKRTATTITLAGMDDRTWNYVSPFSSTDVLGFMPNTPSVTITGLEDNAECQVRIRWTNSSGTNLDINPTVTIGTNVTNKVYANLTFYKYAKMCYKGPVGSTCVYTFKPGRF